MSDYKVTSRYAKSLLELSIEQKSLDAVNNDVRTISESLDLSRDLQLLLASPIVKHIKKKEVLVQIFGKSISDLTLKFISILCEKGRESLLEEILQQFILQYNLHKGIQEASITTTVALNADLRKEFEQLVRKISGKPEVVLVEKIDPDLIGGFKLMVGDRMIDDSISGKLHSLKRQLQA